MARVLVIDDEPDVRWVLRLSLERAGHEVIMAEDGLRGVAMAQRQHPDVIVLDLMMPVMDGREFRAAQVTDPSIAHIPVLVVSAHSDAAAISRQMGAQGFIGKPIIFNQLLSRLETMLKEA